MIAVNAGEDAARACSRLTSTYLNDATASATETASVCDSANTFHPSRQLLGGARLLHPTFALNSHQQNDTSMCRNVRNTGSPKSVLIRSLLVVISTTVEQYHPATAATALKGTRACLRAPEDSPGARPPSGFDGAILAPSLPPASGAL